MAEHTGPQQGRSSEYRTGRTLGKGTYSIVKEAFHTESGTRYACKVINKKLIVGREEMFRNEISVLNHISSTHPNIVTLHDYFETAHNLYLCFELCTGGMLLDVFSRRGRYREPDAARLMKNVLSTVSYIHRCGIVHGDLKPSNLLFLTQDDDSEIMIADFGLSRIVDDNTLVAINEICGTPGYMAPEIFQKAEYGKPVDIWAIGVIAFFILGGYQPFRRHSQNAEQHAVVTGDLKFHPPEPWERVSDTAKDFITHCLTHDPMKRPTALELLDHPWLTAPNAHFQSDPAIPGQPHDLLPFIQKATVEYHSLVESRRNPQSSSAPAHYLSPSAHELFEKLIIYKRESEEDEILILQRHTFPGPPAAKQNKKGGSEVDELREEDDIAYSQGDLALQDVGDPFLTSKTT